MASINKLKPGQILYDRHRYKMGNTTISAWGVWEVLVEEVHAEEGYIIARWNIINPPQKMFIKQIKRLKVKEPKEN